MLYISLWFVKLMRKYWLFRLDRKWWNSNESCFREEMILDGLAQTEVYINQILQK